MWMRFLRSQSGKRRNEPSGNLRAHFVPSGHIDGTARCRKSARHGWTAKGATEVQMCPKCEWHLENDEKYGRFRGFNEMFGVKEPKS